MHRTTPSPPMFVAPDEFDLVLCPDLLLETPPLEKVAPSICHTTLQKKRYGFFLSHPLISPVPVSGLVSPTDSVDVSMWTDSTLPRLIPSNDSLVVSLGLLLLRVLLPPLDSPSLHLVHHLHNYLPFTKRHRMKRLQWTLIQVTFLACSLLIMDFKMAIWVSFKSTYRCHRDADKCIFASCRLLYRLQ